MERVWDRNIFEPTQRTNDYTRKNVQYYCPVGKLKNHNEIELQTHQDVLRLKTTDNDKYNEILKKMILN